MAEWIVTLARRTGDVVIFLCGQRNFLLYQFFFFFKHCLGNGRFANVAGRVGIEAPGWNTAAAFFDADGDGDLDLYIASYIDCTLEDVLKATPTLSWRGLELVAFGPFGLKGAPDHFFRNEGGRFVDATLEAGMKDLALGFGFAVRAVDIDDDGDVA